MNSPFAKHRCHAENCKVEVPPAMFMCKRHWYMVPKRLRDAIWSNYTPGQEVTKNPTLEYLEIARQAIEAVAQKEGINQMAEYSIQEMIGKAKEHVKNGKPDKAVVILASICEAIAAASGCRNWLYNNETGEVRAIISNE